MFLIFSATGLFILFIKRNHTGETFNQIWEIGNTKSKSVMEGVQALKNYPPESGKWLESFSHRACLVARKWAEVRKRESIIAYFPIYPNTGKEK